MEIKFIKSGFWKSEVTTMYAIDDSIPYRIYDKMQGKWVNGIEIANSRSPYICFCNGNISIKRNLLRNIKGAKCVKTWTRKMYDEDPYGRKYYQGEIECSLWDLRECFGITEPLDKFLDFELNEFIQGRASMIY